MKAVVGLGNPGEKYARTRHNIGFRAVSNLADKFSIKADQLKCHSLLGEGSVGDKKIVLAQPLTYMNNSGKAVWSLVKSYNLSKDDLIIIYDDLDLPLGKMRIKNKGSSGGHNGLKSIINYLDRTDFTRIRIGIGSPPEGVDVVDYVLGYFLDEEDDIIEQTLSDISGAVELIEEKSVEEAMNKYN